jgi:pheromone shutdown protein TraB
MKKVKLVGTEHNGKEKTIEIINDEIENSNPDVICLELDPIRYYIKQKELSEQKDLGNISINNSTFSEPDTREIVEYYKTTNQLRDIVKENRRKTSIFMKSLRMKFREGTITTSDEIEGDFKYILGKLAEKDCNIQIGLIDTRVGDVPKSYNDRGILTKIASKLRSNTLYCKIKGFIGRIKYNSRKERHRFYQDNVRKISPFKQELYELREEEMIENIKNIFEDTEVENLLVFIGCGHLKNMKEKLSDDYEVETRRYR